MRAGALRVQLRSHLFRKPYNKQGRFSSPRNKPVAVAARLSAAGFREVYKSGSLVYGMHPSKDSIMRFYVSADGTVHVSMAKRASELLAGVDLLCAALGLTAPQKVLIAR